MVPHGALGQAGLERPADGIAPEIDSARARQQLAPAQMVVEEEAEPHEPGRTQGRLMRQHEGKRADDMRGVAKQHLALDQRLAHQAEFVIFEIAQSAVDQLGAGRGGSARQVVLLDQQDAEAAADGIACDTGTVDATADDQEIDGAGAAPLGRWQACFPPAPGPTVSPLAASSGRP
jgi:hypothetical protein